MTPRSPCRLDALVRHGLREVEHPLAVGEHRGAALLEIQPARVDLAQVGEHLGFERVAHSYERVHLRQELVARETSERFLHDATSAGTSGVEVT
jgi:hypothetical protein